MAESSNQSIVNTIVEEPAPNHPLQHIENIEGPRGAYEVKKTENGIYIRVDIPGVNPNDFKIEKDSNLKEIRFRGPAKNFPDIWRLDNSNRIYCGTIKVECQDFSQLSFEQDFNNGTWRTLIKGAHHAYLTFRTPVNNSESSSSQPLTTVNETRSVLHQPHHRPDNVIIASTRLDPEDDQQRSLTGKWKEEQGEKNPFVVTAERSSKSVFQTKFTAMSDGSGDYRMYFRMDVPGCTINNFKRFVEEQRVGIRFDNESSGDEFKLDEGGGRRVYECIILLHCNTIYKGNGNKEECCKFEVDDYSAEVELGVLRFYIKINGNNLFKDKSVGERFLADNPYSDPPHSSAQCSFSAK